MPLPYASYPSLRDRTVLVTGGASGLGACFVQHFAAQGAVVGFLDVDEAAARATIAAVTSAGGPTPTFAPCDVRDVGALQRGIERLSGTLGPIRVLVNSAADDLEADLAAVTPQFWDDGIAANLRHLFFAAQAVRTGMATAGGGSIINMGSIAWVQAEDRARIVYHVAKSAIEGLTRALARELGAERIRVNSILPGWVMTEKQRQRITPMQEAWTRRHQCLKRLLEPEDVARLALWLAADDSQMVTNQGFVIDAGWT